MLKSFSRVTSALALAGFAGAMAAASCAADTQFDARNLPADDKVIFIMGQDSDTLSEYKRDVLDQDPDMPRPGGVTVYSHIHIGRPDGGQPLDGLVRKGNWGSGDVDMALTMEEYPDAAIAVGLWFTDVTTGCANIPARAIAGTGEEDVKELTSVYRAHVDEMITALKDTDRPVYLRIGYEFDGPWNCYQTEPYKQAFRYIKTRIDAMDADNIATVWQTASWPRDEQTDNPAANLIVGAEGHFDVWYPGDDVVDWVSLSTFYGTTYADYQWACADQNPEWFSAHHKPRVLQDRALEFARAHNKPVMISEAAPQGFNTSENKASCIFARQEVDMSAETLWDVWYQDWFDYIEANRDIIRAVAYINTYWNSQPMWRCDAGASAGSPNCSSGYWGDSRVQGDPLILERFKRELQKPIYVNGSEAAGAVMTPKNVSH